MKNRKIVDTFIEDLLSKRPERKREMGGFNEYFTNAVNENEKWDGSESMYQDAMNDLLRVGIENLRLEKQNEELEKRVKSLQQGALHAENKRLREDLNAYWSAIMDVKTRLSEL